MTEFVELETAQRARGVRLVLLARSVSAWSEAARAALHVKRIPFVAVRYWPPAPDVLAWARGHNAPVVLHDDEPPRSGWAEILALAERLAPEPRLVPRDPAERVEAFGLSHELLGEDGVVWNARLVLIDAGLASGGEVGFPLPVARYLAGKYGHRPGIGPAAREALRVRLALCAERLERGRARGGAYYFGAELSALDLHSAAAMHGVVPFPAELCPGGQLLAPSFAWLAAELGDAVPRVLVEHRRYVYERHLELPIQL